MKKINKCFLFIFIVFIILNTFLICSAIYKKNIQDNYFRLHVIANSNSIKDQNLKYIVARNVTNYISKLYKEEQVFTKNTAKNTVINNIDEILEIARDTIKKENYNYKVKADIGNIKYDKKINNEIEMAKGTYDSIRIIIGNGNGKNFWSLIYPYSYVGCIENNIYSEKDLSNIDTQDIVNSENNTYTFKMYELIKNLF